MIFIASKLGESELFRSKIDVLSKTLTKHASFIQFMDTLVTNDLITMAVKRDLTTRSNYSDIDRASQLVDVLFTNISLPLSPDYFTCVCEALANQEDPILKGIGQTMAKC